MNKLFRVALFSCVVSLLFACGAEVSDAKYVERAQEYLDKGEFKAASIELKNALQSNHSNSGARWLLGKVYLETGNFAGAEKELRKASEFGMADEPILPLLGQALLYQGKNDEVQVLSLENLTADGQATVLAQQGLGKLVQRDIEKATVLVDKALSKNPESVYAIVAKARIFAAEREFDLARKQLETAFQLDPDFALAWSLLGDIEEQERHPELALEAYTRAIEQSANSVGEQLKRALLLIHLEKYDEAQQDIDSIKQRAPHSTGINYAQGLIYYRNMEYKEAQSSFTIAIKNEDRYPMALYYLSATHLLQGNREQAKTYAGRFFTINPNNIAGRKLLATVRLDNQEYAAAEKLMRPVVDARDDDVVALNLLANALMKQGKTDEAIDLLAKVAELQPDSPPAQTRLGEALLAGGDQGSGIDHLEKALQLDPQHKQADILLVLNHLQMKDFGQAIKAAEAYREKNPENVTPYNLLGRVYIAANQEAEAREAFTKARTIAPGDPYACDNLALLALKKKDFDSARSYYEEVLENHENHLSTLLQLAALYALQNNEGSMLEHLRQAVNAHPNALQPKLVLARYYLTRGKPGQVSLLFANLGEIQQENPEVLNVIAVSQLAQKEFSRARLTLKRLLELQPESAQTHYLMANAYTGLENRAQTQIELQRAIELSPKHLPAHLALARIFLQERNKKGAEKQLSVLRELAPEHPDVLKLEASMARWDGDQEESLRISSLVFEKFPTTSNMLILAHQKWDMGDRDGSLQLQQLWVDKHPDDIIARLELANVLAANNQMSLAIKQYSIALDKDEGNLVALNNLAWYLRDTQPQQALEYATRANDINPDSPTLMDTLAVALLKNGDIEKAQRTIARVLAMSPNNPSMQYHSAMIEASAGNKVSAIKTLQSITEVSTNFPEKEEARKLLDQLQRE